MSEVSFLSSNQILSALPNSVYQRLKPHLELISLIPGQVLHKSGETIKEVYFPHQALISLVLIMSDKSTTEIGLVGNEGMVGLTAILGGDSTTSLSMVQIAGTAMKLPSNILNEEFHRGEELQQLLLLYTQAQLSQISHIAACQSQHIIEQRFARWLLLVRDCTGRDSLPLTQKLIALMLGVRRASITEAAISLQQAGIINYSRGQILIVNPKKLEQIACECYGNIKSEYTRLLGSIKDLK
ncbi:MAG: Crp/Fnr family transcriptional regulator [Xenococcaceae cyanobacterium MO_167.B27]|nr:Crp/Fnr family transcriptional regulator [Xenococcaceae cyanobacterium MO_167.B27]